MRFPWRRRLLLLALVTAGALLVGCGGGAGESRERESRSTRASSGEPETVNVSMKDNFFEPKDITVERGRAITFVVKNDGEAIHDMHILSATAEGKDFLSNPTVQPGESSKFTATFTKAGSLKFQCDYHLPDMVGTITVK